MHDVCIPCPGTELKSAHIEDFGLWQT